MPEDEQKLTSAVFGLLYNLSLEGAAAIDVRRAVPLACAILAAHSPGPEPSPGASATPTRDAATSASGSSTTSSISGTISERALGLLARLLARQSTAAEIASDKKTRTLLVRTTLACCEALLAALSRLTENANVSGDALLLASGFEREETLLKRARALVRCILFIVKSSKELHANTKGLLYCNYLFMLVIINKMSI